MANNPYVNKVQYGNTTLIDLTSDTVTADKLMQGYTAHDRTGALITGTATGGGSGDGYVWQDGNGYVHLSDEQGTQTIIDALTVSSSGTTTAPTGHAYSPVTVPSGTASTPATSVTANPSISVSSGGLITATASATKSVTPSVSAGWVSSGTAGTITVSGSNTSQLSTEAGKTVTPTESEQTAVASGKYTTGAIKVGAISSSYVGSGITRRYDDDMTASADTDYYVVKAPSGYYPSSAEYYIPIKTSADLTASGATVSVPSGYYASNASKSVASGTEGTPTATKGAVSNHSISVTPSVTNTGGYISGSTKTGTAVSVSASELVSGTLTISSSGTKDVTNYASVSVPSGTEGTPTATKGTVSSNSISVTPSVTNSTGYITGGTKTGTAVTVSASELVSGTKSISANGTGIDVANYASVDVAVPTGSATLITKSITANGTYNASSDGADGYSQVTVNVSGGGGSTNIVSGDFTAGTAGTVQTINIPYTGTGYIVSLMISVDGGLRGEYFYNVEHRYACGMFCGSKYYVTQAPNYTANNANYNGLTVLATIKGTSGTAYSSVGSGSSGSAVIYATADPSASSITSIVRITSKNVIKVFISESSSGYGFLSGAKYNYVVVYSE